MASLTRWTIVWVNSGCWWWTGMPNVLQFMWSQIIAHDWATELNWTEGRKSVTYISLEQLEINLMAVSQDSLSQGIDLIALCHDIYSHLWWRNWKSVKMQPLKSTQHRSYWRPWGTPNSSPAVPGGWPTYDLVLERMSHRNMFGNPPVQGSQEVDMPRPSQGFDLQEAVMPQFAWGSAPWPRDTWLSDCNSTG